MYQIDFNKPIHIHFIGIGGISMSGLAKLLNSRGFTISGSDWHSSDLTKELEALGIQIFIGQQKENITNDIDLVVYTAAVKEDNEEFLATIEANIPLMPRSILLGQIMKQYLHAVGIAGTHGKTTTTSLLSALLLAGELDPTISVGGVLNLIGGNLRIGHSDYFVAEACEYTNTFLSLSPTDTIILNIEEDHLDYFEDSFLIESAQRYDIKGKAYIETPKKYYFSDLGLRNARINFRQFEQTHSMENVIYNELRMRGYSVDVGVVPIAEKDKDGKVVRKALEVDFVCNLGSARYYIQSAYSLPDEAKRNQEIRPFRKIDDSFKKIVVTKDIVPTHYDENGILTVNIYEFLLNPGSIEG